MVSRWSLNTGLPKVPDALQGVWSKIDRAYEHLETYEDLLPDFRKSQPCSWASEIDPDTNDKVWRVTGHPTAPPFHWNVVIGDCHYNFRSSLDHLAWQLVLIHGNTPTRSTAFPLFQTPSDWKRFSPARLKGIGSKAVALIEQTQPCFGSNTYRNKILGWLDGLHNVDKHRHFNLTIAGTMGGFWHPGLPVRASTEVFIHEGPVENGTELARVPEKYAYVEFTPALDIAFGNGTSAAGEGILGLLIGIREVLARIILPQFYAFFP